MKKSLKLKYVFKGNDWEVLLENLDTLSIEEIKQFAISKINQRLGFRPGDCDFVLLYGRSDEINSKTETQYFMCFNVLEKPPQTKPTKTLYTTVSSDSSGSRVSHRTITPEPGYDLDFEDEPSQKNFGFFSHTQEEGSDEEDNYYSHR